AVLFGARRDGLASGRPAALAGAGPGAGRRRGPRARRSRHAGTERKPDEAARGMAADGGGRGHSPKTTHGARKCPINHWARAAFHYRSTVTPDGRDARKEWRLRGKAVPKS